MARKRFSVLALLVIATMLLASCGGNAAPTATVPAAAPTTAPTAAQAEPTNTEAAAAPTTAPTAAATTAAGGETPTTMAGQTPSTGGGDRSMVGAELANAYAGQYKGTKVTMFGPFGDQDEVKFNNSVKDFEAATGIDIQYQGDKTFETTIVVRVNGGNPPDIADFPQPGGLATIAKTGKVLDASKFINSAWLKKNYNQSFLDIATVDNGSGTKILAGVFQRVNGKSLVWYPKKAWDAAGYTVPQTWDEMKTLMDKIVADGDTPWCIGIGSGDATGWPATDWIEDIMLRTTSLENYDKWTRGELAFNSPEVKNAVQMMSDIWQDKYVYGGRKQIVSTEFGNSVAPMFTDPPGCYLHRQGNFITSFFESAKAGVKGGEDYDFFYLPPIDSQYGKPFEFAGDVMAAFNDRPEVRAVMQWFSTFDGVKGWVAAGGALSPHNDSDPSVYTSKIDARVADLLRGASSLRFDGSDLMPAAVNKAFWKNMTDYVSGTTELDPALKAIQDSWATVAP